MIFAAWRGSTWQGVTSNVTLESLRNPVECGSASTFEAASIPTI